MKLTESFNPDFPIAFTLSEIERTEVQTLMNQNIFEEWCDTVLGPSGYTTEENTVLISDLDAALKFKLRWELEEVIE